MSYQISVNPHCTTEYTCKGGGECHRSEPDFLISINTYRIQLQVGGMGGGKGCLAMQVSTISSQLVHLQNTQVCGWGQGVCCASGH